MHLDLFFFSVILLFARSLLYRNLLLLPSIPLSLVLPIATHADLISFSLLGNIGAAMISFLHHSKPKHIRPLEIRISYSSTFENWVNRERKRSTEKNIKLRSLSILWSRIPLLRIWIICECRRFTTDNENKILQIASDLLFVAIRLKWMAVFSPFNAVCNLVELAEIIKSMDSPHIDSAKILQRRRKEHQPTTLQQIIRSDKRNKKQLGFLLKFCLSAVLLTLRLNDTRFIVSVSSAVYCFSCLGWCLSSFAVLSTMALSVVSMVWLQWWMAVI